jgi:hypothetical protein
MDDQQPRDRYPRDKNQLIREIDLARELKDIRDSIHLRYILRPQWWETMVGVVQFAAALGLLASLLHQQSTSPDSMNKLVVFWAALMVLALVFGFEMMIFKIHHLRRANEISLRLIDDLRNRVENMEKPNRETHESTTGPSGEGTGSSDKGSPRATPQPPKES